MQIRIKDQIIKGFNETQKRETDDIEALKELLN
jgi:hypothetical protein